MRSRPVLTLVASVASVGAAASVPSIATASKVVSPPFACRPTGSNQLSSQCLYKPLLKPGATVRTTVRRSCRVGLVSARPASRKFQLNGADESLYYPLPKLIELRGDVTSVPGSSLDPPDLRVVVRIRQGRRISITNRWKYNVFVSLTGRCKGEVAVL